MKNWLVNHFNAKYLFDTTPQADNGIVIFFIILSCLLVILAIASVLLLAKKATSLPPYGILKDKIFSTFLTMGIIGFLLTFVYWQEIPYLSLPFILLIFVIVIIGQIVYIILFYRKILQTDMKDYQQQISYEKYLPKHKHKNN